MTLLAIKRKHGLVYCMEQGGALSKKDLAKILGGLSRVTGQDYSIETVGGYWVKQEEQV